jgi:hypothetical protein
MKGKPTKTKMNILCRPFQVFALACLVFIQHAQAVSPAPDGGYPGGNTAEGQNALFGLGSGTYNTALGFFSLKNNTTGNLNTAIGAGTLLLNTADQNTATGAAALLSNTTGSSNTANGSQALLSNTTGNSNTANGVFALLHNTTGSFNTANGGDALDLNITGSFNTAIGFDALVSNTIGFQNSATGYQALYFNTGGFNTANGVFALFNNTTGSSNTAYGVNALFHNTSGSGNTAVGAGAGNAVTAASNVIAIGIEGADVDASCFIGNVYSNNQPVVGNDPDYVTVTSAGRLGRGNISSRRYKHDIKPMATTSEALFGLRPASFRYNKEYDATQTLAFGLIAEEVAEVYPDLVGRNARGQPESVRYDQINAMLLNEFLKEHKKVEEQANSIAELKSIVAQQRKDFETTTTQQQKGFQSRFAKQESQIQALALDIQKVSARLEMRKATPRVATNHP